MTTTIKANGPMKLLVIIVELLRILKFISNGNRYLIITNPPPWRKTHALVVGEIIGSILSITPYHS